MKVLNLQCRHAHAFEGWFASEDDFQDQRARGLVVAAPDAQLQAAWMQLVRQVMANTEDVGEKFAEEARKIHYGETDERGIRGQASPEETRALLEEGISVLPLPIPKGLKGPLQ